MLALWDIATGEEIRRFFEKPYVVTVAFSPDGKTLAAEYEGNVLLWESATGKERHRFPSDGSVTSLAFSPNGQILAMASLRSVKRWQPWESTSLTSPPERNLASSRDIKRAFLPLAFSPDGKTLASGSYPAQAQLHGQDGFDSSSAQTNKP